MAEAGVAFPQVFVVDAQAGVPPPATCPQPRHSPVSHRVLYLLVTLALCGVAVEACFIYRLYSPDKGDSGMGLKDFKDGRGNEVLPTEMSSTTLKPLQASAHLTEVSMPVQENGELNWGMNGDAFVRGLEHKAGMLQVQRAGLYFIYSKVSFAEPSCSLFKHTVQRRTPRYSRSLELMKATRFSCRRPKPSEPGTLNSYLGGVYHLHSGDCVFVKVENHTLIRHHDTTDNFFGMFMI
ncbi:hypothetical protein JZ751_015728 [Albula glossodonta]|uniref:THD domain-containing protein n=1 Tax=Albula glossodonta TaxID=121402 RepID=A0A8T2N3A3_9TELE|nr:hypothetical protein JZ751_015728 [Albula glossodonta]